MSKPVKTFFPQTRLSELTSRPGGIARSDAIESAQKSIESLREQGDATILKSIGEIEAIAFTARGNRLTNDQMLGVLKLADQIVTLAGTFQYPNLDKVARSLCDLTDGLVNTHSQDAAPILVHVQSMRLLAPGGMNLTPEQVGHVLAELGKVLAHYNFGSLAMPGVAEDGEIALNPR